MKVFFKNFFVPKIKTNTTTTTTTTTYYKVYHSIVRGVGDAMTLFQTRLDFRLFQLSPPLDQMFPKLIYGLLNIYIAQGRSRRISEGLHIN